MRSRKGCSKETRAGPTKQAYAALMQSKVTLLSAGMYKEKVVAQVHEIENRPPKSSCLLTDRQTLPRFGDC
jgi:hypothetical protein